MTHGRQRTPDVAFSTWPYQKAPCHLAIKMPPERFLGDFRARTGKPIRGISSDAMRKLTEYTLPGNVRELQSALEFAAIRTRGATIDVHVGPFRIDMG